MNSVSVDPFVMIRLLYEGVPGSVEQQQASQWLLAFQGTPAAWDTCAQCLAHMTRHPSTHAIAPTTQFCITQILHRKLQRDWSNASTPLDISSFGVAAAARAREAVCDLYHLIGSGAVVATLEPVVVRQLTLCCICLGFHGIHGGWWTNFLADILSMFAVASASSAIVQVQHFASPVGLKLTLDVLGEMPSELAALETIGVMSREGGREVAEVVGRHGARVHALLYSVIAAASNAALEGGGGDREGFAATLGVAALRALHSWVCAVCDERDDDERAASDDDDDDEDEDGGDNDDDGMRRWSRVVSECTKFKMWIPLGDMLSSGLLDCLLSLQVNAARARMEGLFDAVVDVIVDALAARPTPDSDWFAREWHCSDGDDAVCRVHAMAVLRVAWSLAGPQGEIFRQALAAGGGGDSSTADDSFQLAVCRGIAREAVSLAESHAALIWSGGAAGQAAREAASFSERPPPPPESLGSGILSLLLQCTRHRNLELVAASPLEFWCLAPQTLLQPRRRTGTPPLGSLGADVQAHHTGALAAQGCLNAGALASMLPSLASTLLSQCRLGRYMDEEAWQHALYGCGSGDRLRAMATAADADEQIDAQADFRRLVRDTFQSIHNSWPTAVCAPDAPVGDDNAAQMKFSGAVSGGLAALFQQALVAEASVADAEHWHNTEAILFSLRSIAEEFVEEVMEDDLDSDGGEYGGGVGRGFTVASALVNESSIGEQDLLWTHIVLQVTRLPPVPILTAASVELLGELSPWIQKHAQLEINHASGCAAAASSSGRGGRVAEVAGGVRLLKPILELLLRALSVPVACRPAAVALRSISRNCGRAIRHRRRVLARCRGCMNAARPVNAPGSPMRHDRFGAPPVVESVVAACMSDSAQELLRPRPIAHAHVAEAISHIASAHLDPDRTVQMVLRVLSPAIAQALAPPSSTATTTSVYQARTNAILIVGATFRGVHPPAAASALAQQLWPLIDGAEFRADRAADSGVAAALCELYTRIASAAGLRGVTDGPPSEEHSLDADLALLQALLDGAVACYMPHMLPAASRCVANLLTGYSHTPQSEPFFSRAIAALCASLNGILPADHRAPTDHLGRPLPHNDIRNAPEIASSHFAMLRQAIFFCPASLCMRVTVAIADMPLVSWCVAAAVTCLSLPLPDFDALKCTLAFLDAAVQCDHPQCAGAVVASLGHHETQRLLQALLSGLASPLWGHRTRYIGDALFNLLHGPSTLPPVAAACKEVLPVVVGNSFSAAVLNDEAKSRLLNEMLHRRQRRRFTSFVSEFARQQRR